MELISDSEIDRKEWNKLLSGSEFSSPFQTPEFLSIYNSLEGQSAQVFAIRKEESLIALCVVTIQKESGLKGFFSRRGIIYGGPLLAGGSKDALRALLEGLKEKLRNQIIYIEIRNLFSYNDYRNLLGGLGWDYIPYLNSEIDLHQKTMESLLGAMKYNRRREINQSLKHGATYRLAHSEAEIQELYCILKDLYTKRVKLPLPSLDYFFKLFHSPIGKIFIVVHDQKIIGGSICYYRSAGNIYTLYYCGLRDYSKGIYPTHLAILAAMDFGVNEKLHKLDLMGTGKRGKEYGVRQYKSEFGGDQVEYGRFLSINNPFLFKLGTTALQIKKMLKR